MTLTNKPIMANVTSRTNKEVTHHLGEIIGYHTMGEKTFAIIGYTK